ncbi:MAG: DUF4157 domain-containing protein, partial [Flexilinea sp.]|nr:DUF4157 domain-containing protein [Flexilinea sp.]
MAYQNEKQTQAAGQDESLRPEEQLVPEQRFSMLPNSLMMATPMTPPPGTPNSVMREMLDPQIPSAEAEADRLSAGIRHGTPDSVRKEMGKRLGSDFSSVRFHTGPESIRRNRSMGSVAYTRGSDIFFGSRGFDPSVGAHELVHTVQQGAVSGHVSQSVPYGTIQRNKFTDFFKKHFGSKKAADNPAQDPVHEESSPGPEAGRDDRKKKPGLFRRFLNKFSGKKEVTERHAPAAEPLSSSEDSEHIPERTTDEAATTNPVSEAPAPSTSSKAEAPEPATGEPEPAPEAPAPVTVVESETPKPAAGETKPAPESAHEEGTAPKKNNEFPEIGSEIRLPLEDNKLLTGIVVDIKPRSDLTTTTTTTTT